MAFIGIPDSDVIGMQSFKLTVLAHPMREGAVGYFDHPEMLAPRQTWWGTTFSRHRCIPPAGYAVREFLESIS